MSELWPFLLGILGNFVASEIYQNAPALANWLLERAARRMPSGVRQSILDRWKTKQAELAGNFAKLAHAFGIYWQVRFKPKIALKRALSSADALSGRHWFAALVIVAAAMLVGSSFLSLWDAIRGVFAENTASFFLASVLTVLQFSTLLAVSRPAPSGISKWRALIRSCVIYTMLLTVLTIITIISYPILFSIMLRPPDGVAIFPHAMLALRRGDRLAQMSLAVSAVQTIFVVVVAMMVWPVLRWANQKAARSNPVISGTAAIPDQIHPPKPPGEEH
jgi:hypothetical protein